MILSKLTLILLCAGNSSRFEMGVKKQWIRIDETPLWLYVTQNFEATGMFEKIILVGAPHEVPFMRHYTSHQVVEGGNTRQQSLQNALDFVTTEYVLVSDVARACVKSTMLQKILSHKKDADCIVPYLKATDTIVYDGNTIDREKVKRVQTPQLSKTEILKKALDTTEEFTDESSAIVAYGGTRAFVLGDEDAHKITTIQDLHKLPCLQAPSDVTLSGNGFDVHAFDTQGQMWLGGVKIDVEYGFKAHSDGDVAIHSLIDALLGAAGMGDIGTLFPDTDESYAGVDSKELLKDVVTKLHNFGFTIVNVDLTIAAQQPRLANYKDAMRTTLASILHLEPNKVNIKATTTEKLGFIGRSEGVGVWSNANLKYYNWKKQ